MGFQISYIFEAQDKFTKVAKKIAESIDNIEKRVKGTIVNLQKLEDRGQRNLQNLEKVTAHTEQTFGKLNTRIKKGNLAMQSMKLIAVSLKFRLASLLVGSVLAGFGFGRAMTSALDFQDVLLEMQALTGATGKDLDFLKKTAFDFGKVFGKSGADAMTGIKQTADAFPSLLKNMPGLRAMTKEAMVLATAAGMTIPDSVKALNAVLNIFQKDASEAKDVINTLAAGALLSNVMTEQLTASIIRGGGAARSLQVSLPRAIALINAMGSSEIKEGKAGTALNMIMIKMSKNKIKLGDETRKLSEIVGELKQRYEAAGDAGVAYLAKLVTAPHVKAILAWFANIDKLDAWEKGVQRTNEAYRQAEIRLKSYRTVLGQFGAEWDEKVSGLFEKIEPALKIIIQQFRIFLEILDTALPGGIKGTIVFLIWGLARIAQLLNVIALLVGIFMTPIRMMFGDIFAIPRMIKLYKKIKEIETPMTLETLSAEAERAVTTGKGIETSSVTKGRVRVDLNIKGNTDAINSVHATTEGDVDFNTGKNMAFIGY